MGSDVAETAQAWESLSLVKVHSPLCRELTRVIYSIMHIIPAIESARPGCMSGIQELCSINNAIEKAKLLCQHCAESSKLYLAITTEATLLRCERIRNSLDQSLSQIQNMVPQLLANQITEIVNGLRDAKFTMDSSELEAGRVILDLLRQSERTEDTEFQAFCVAASKLNITSPKDILVERRSVKRLLDKLHNVDSNKKSILNYLLYLLKKYGKNLRTKTYGHKENVVAQSKCLSTDSLCNDSLNVRSDEPAEAKSQDKLDCKESRTGLTENVAPPEEFRCPISSRLMCDPVVIASGQTYERIWIQKWFSEGHVTCPKTQKKLSCLSLIPNSNMKDLISNWCQKHGISPEDPCSQPIPAAFHYWDTANSSSNSSLNSISAVIFDGKATNYVQSDQSNISLLSSDASYSSGSSQVEDIENLKGVQMFSWCDDYLKCQSFSNFTPDMYLRFLSRLSELPLEPYCEAMDDVKMLFYSKDEAYHSMLSNGFVEALLKFLKNSSDLSNVRAQKTGAQILLAFLSNSRVEIPPLGDDAFQLLASFLDSEITAEVLMIMQILSCIRSCRTSFVASDVLYSILRILDSGVCDFQELALKILCDLSTDSEIGYRILSSGWMSKLVPLLGDTIFLEHCIAILHNLCDIEGGGTEILETKGSIALIVEILDSGNRKVQEHAVAVLYSLCSRSIDYCSLVLKEGAIPSLVDISINGNSQGMESSMKLLHLLRDLRHDEDVDSSRSHGGSSSDSLHSHGGSGSDSSKISSSHTIERRPTSKSSGFFARKMRFSKLKYLIALS